MLYLLPTLHPEALHAPHINHRQHKQQHHHHHHHKGYNLLCFSLINNFYHQAYNHYLLPIPTHPNPVNKGFYLWPVHVGFVVDKVTIEQVFLRILWFSNQYKPTNAPCSFIHSHIINVIYLSN
jgi:hypothetical protein